MLRVFLIGAAIYLILVALALVVSGAVTVPGMN